MVTAWVIAAIWGLGSVLWVELVRDLYHVLSHTWPLLYQLHVWHHRAFHRDLTLVDSGLYQKAQWLNDVPECGVMLLFSLFFWACVHAYAPMYQGMALLGTAYTLAFLLGAIARGSGLVWAHKLTDLTHLPGSFTTPPSGWFVNRTYHWRHHFDNQRAYYCSTLTLIDKLMGTALSLKGKTVAVTGASGTLGQALLQHLRTRGAKVIALTSGDTPVVLKEKNGQPVPLPTTTWQVGQETQLCSLLDTVDILVLNHGINVYGERTEQAIARSYDINAFSSWRLLERFLTTVQTDADIARKEVWINTSEAEVSPAFSPLYELSKRTLGDLVTLRRLDTPCVLRKVILGPFKSPLNPFGVMSADWVARQIISLAQRDVRNIIVTINPLTYVTYPLKEFCVSTYFKLFTRRTAGFSTGITEH